MRALLRIAAEEYCVSLNEIADALLDLIDTRILSWNEIFGAFIAGKCFENVADDFLCLVRGKDARIYQVKKSIGYLV